MDDVSTNRFTRMAPITRLIHYCPKNNCRQFYEVCQARECRHFRPLRPPDEGSCVFRPKEKKEVDKRIKGKRDKVKNGSHPVDQEEYSEAKDQSTEGQQFSP